MPEISLPNNWKPRHYQREFFEAMDKGSKRAVLVNHRRAGKDSCALNFTAKQVFKRIGNYWTCLPKIAQARKAIWKGVDREGRRIIDQAFPKEIRAKTNEQEMLIEFVNGSTWQLVGSDNYDAMVGSNPIGITFSEYSIADPSAWNYFRPMLAENGGWAVFIYTPRGKNHGYTLYEMAKNNPEWFSQLVTVNDSKRDDGTPVIGPDIIAEERAEGMAEEMIQQEYYCSFEAQIPGAIYSQQLAAARDDGRITNLPIDPQLEVHTAWDLGISDAMSLWFFQAIGKEIRLIHYYENHNQGMDHYAQYLQEFKAKHHIHYGEHLAPHDIEVRELTSGRSRKDIARDMGVVFRTTERPRKKPEGHQAVRKIFPMLWIDSKRAEMGLNGISEYQYEWDDKKKMFKDSPLHNWASHPADALQTLALGWQPRMVSGRPPPKAHNMKVNINVF